MTNQSLRAANAANKRNQVVRDRASGKHFKVTQPKNAAYQKKKYHIKKGTLSNEEMEKARAANTANKQKQRARDIASGKHFKVTQPKNAAYQKKKYHSKKGTLFVQAPVTGGSSSPIMDPEHDITVDIAPVIEAGNDNMYNLYTNITSPVVQAGRDIMHNLYTNVTSPAVESGRDIIVDTSEYKSFNDDQHLRHQKRGDAMKQAFNGTMFDEWPVVPAVVQDNEQLTTHRRSTRYCRSSQQLHDPTKCCQCTDGCATICPCAARMTSCYSCKGPCGGNPFENDLFIRAPWLEEIEADNKGKGVISKVDLFPNNLLVRYEGRRVTNEREIQKIYDRDGPRYAFILNSTTVIDGLHGGIAKFINHSCDPNLVALDWIQRTKGRNGKLVKKEHICFHVAKRIRAGEELTLKYMMDDRETSTRKCHCGSNKCNGKF